MLLTSLVVWLQLLAGGLLCCSMTVLRSPKAVDCIISCEFCVHAVPTYLTLKDDDRSQRRDDCPLLYGVFRSHHLEDVRFCPYPAGFVRLVSWSAHNLSVMLTTGTRRLFLFGACNFEKCVFDSCLTISFNDILLLSFSLLPRVKKEKKMRLDFSGNLFTRTIDARIGVRAQSHARTHTYTYTHTHTRTHARTHAHTYIHTYIHTNTHTHKPGGACHVRCV